MILLICVLGTFHEPHHVPCFVRQLPSITFTEKQFQVYESTLRTSEVSPECPVHPVVRVKFLLLGLQTPLRVSEV